MLAACSCTSGVTSGWVAGARDVMRCTPMGMCTLSRQLMEHDGLQPVACCCFLYSKRSHWGCLLRCSCTFLTPGPRPLD